MRALSWEGAGMQIISPSTQERIKQANATIKDLPYWVEVSMFIRFDFLSTKAPNIKSCPSVICSFAGFPSILNNDKRRKQKSFSSFVRAKLGKVGLY